MQFFEYILVSDCLNAYTPSVRPPFAWMLGIGVVVIALLIPGSLQAQISQKVISTNVNAATDVDSADVDGDGDLDVISASYTDDKIAWFENQIGESEADSDGFGDQQVITTSTDNADAVAVGDLDGDDDLDVLSASVNDDKIAWYENQVGESGADSDGFGDQKVITTSADGAQSVAVGDLDGDDDLDVLSTSGNDGKIAWYENQVGESGADSDGFGDQKVITSSVANPETPAVGDLDGDNDLDVVSASEFDDEIAWYENQVGESGADSDGFGTKKVISTSADGATSVAVGDLDGDNDLDVLSASVNDNKIAWYENQVGESGADSDGFGDQKVITTSASDATSVAVGDLDGDGDLDVLSASGSDAKIAWYENQIGESGADSDGFGDQKVITTSASDATSVAVGDLDGDDDLDVLSSSFGDDKIAWYENTEGVLPVELASLTARADGSGARLTWETASETNNAGFYVQHRSASEEGSQAAWSRLGFVEGAGTTSNPQSYQFKADNLGPGTHEFRLRQVDTDGTTHLSRVVSTEIQMRKKARLTAPVPNPVASTARLTLAVKESEKATVTLYNTLGQRVATLYEGRPTPGEQVSLRLDASTLGSGAYIIRLKAGSTTKSQQVTVVR